MQGGYVSNAGEFLISTLFGFYIICVLLRFLFQYLRADFYNPISQFLVTITSPVLRPMRRWIPGTRGVDWAAVVLLVILKALEIWIIYAIHGYVPHPAGLLVLTIGELLSLLIYVFLIAIFVVVILSWISPGTYNPATSLLISLTEPLLRPARRMVPPIGGLDLSPIVVLVVLQLTQMLIVAPLLDLGRQLM